MPEDYPKEYEIEVEYDVVTVARDFHTVKVKALDDDEAMEKAKDKIWDYELIDDEDNIDFIELKITKVVSTEPGMRDDRTLDIFKKEE